MIVLRKVQAASLHLLKPALAAVAKALVYDGRRHHSLGGICVVRCFELARERKAEFLSGMFVFEVILRLENRLQVVVFPKPPDAQQVSRKFRAIYNVLKQVVLSFTTISDKLETNGSNRACPYAFTIGNVQIDRRMVIINRLKHATIVDAVQSRARVNDEVS